MLNNSSKRYEERFDALEKKVDAKAKDLVNCYLSLDTTGNLLIGDLQEVCPELKKLMTE